MGKRDASRRRGIVGGHSWMKIWKLEWRERVGLRWKKKLGQRFESGRQFNNMVWWDCLFRSVHYGMAVYSCHAWLMVGEPRYTKEWTWKINSWVMVLTTVNCFSLLFCLAVNI